MQYSNPQYECTHAETVLLLDCRAGGTQYRHYCRECWDAVDGPIPHVKAREEERRNGYEAPLADLKTLHAAQDIYWRRSRALIGSEA